MRRLASVRIASWVLLLVAGVAGIAGAAVGAARSPVVVVVPISGTVDAGMEHLVQRAVATADDLHASALVLDVNSPGGLVDAAFGIRDAILGARVPTIAFISERAYSAAALIALSARHIAIAPGASIGAAEPIPATPKTISALRAEFASTAERNGRNPTLAAAMVDATVAVPPPVMKAPHEVLTLDTMQALRAHIADRSAPTLRDALAAFGLERARIVRVHYTWAERLARFATDPVVSGILLTIGMLGLLIELQTLHGIAGAVGIGALALFFGAHIYAGFSDALVLLLAALGVAGILVELHVLPGHGAPGILGAIALLLAVLLAFGVPFLFIAVETVATAVVCTAIGFALAARIFPENLWFRRLVLATAQGPDYVAAPDYRALIGSTGVAETYLRPTGIARIGDHRVDVLTAGEFIPRGTPLRVVRVEGARIFVEPIREN